MSVTLDHNDVNFFAARLRRLCDLFGYSLPDFAADDERLVGIAPSVIGAILTRAQEQQGRVDTAIRRQRRAYFAHNPPNTWLAQTFNDLLAVNGTFESDMAKNAEREARASDGVPVLDSKTLSQNTPMVGKDDLDSDITTGEAK